MNRIVETWDDRDILGKRGVQASSPSSSSLRGGRRDDIRQGSRHMDSTCCGQHRSAELALHCSEVIDLDRSRRAVSRFLHPNFPMRVCQSGH